MAKRVKHKTRDIVGIIFRQDGRCPRCGEKLGHVDDMELDHIIPLAAGGTDTPDNLQAIHVDCHKVKTNGTKATSYGSDKHEIAKTKRLEKRRLAAEAQERERLNAETYSLIAPKPRRDTKPKRRAWGRRKLRSRGFPKKDRTNHKEERPI